MAKLPDSPPPERSFLADLDDMQRQALERRGVRRSYQAGAALFHERQVADKVIAILSGRVKIVSINEDGRETVLAFQGPGTLLGDISAIDEEPRSAGAFALEAVEALVVPNPQFRAWLASDPAALMLMLEAFARRQRATDRKRAEYGGFDAVGRLATGLLELADRYGVESDEGIVVDIPVSQEELAGWIGASREAVAKSLRTLRECGWVSTARRRITITDAEALRRRGA